jgi:hypothetical protein
VYLAGKHTYYFPPRLLFLAKKQENRAYNNAKQHNYICSFTENHDDIISIVTTIPTPAPTSELAPTVLGRMLQYHTSKHADWLMSILGSYLVANVMCAQRAVLPKTSQRSVPNVMSCPKLEI